MRHETNVIYSLPESYNLSLKLLLFGFLDFWLFRLLDFWLFIELEQLKLSLHK